MTVVTKYASFWVLGEHAVGAGDYSMVNSTVLLKKGVATSSRVSALTLLFVHPLIQLRHDWAAFGVRLEMTRHSKDK